jgi:RNA-directed DNA polymerase
MRAVLSLTDKGYKAQPLARIDIPKPNSGKMRPLSIPTFYDRAMQALYTLALQPRAETTADISSLGFRIKRCAQDAAAYLFIGLSKDHSATYVLEGDIRGCFDNISHEWLLENIPMDKKVLAEFVQAIRGHPPPYSPKGAPPPPGERWGYGHGPMQRRGYPHPRNRSGWTEQHGFPS